MKIKVILFPVNSEDGEELVEKVSTLLQGDIFDLEILFNPSQSEMTRKSVSNDLVILDATIESNGRHNYAAFTAQPAAMDHILVVSRSYLPINFHGLREGGSPKYPNQQNNSEIINWLQTEINDLLPHLPRPRKHKKFILGSILTPFHSLKTAAQRASGQHQVFISYRSRAYQEVKKLVKNIEQGNYHQNPVGVRILEPGELAYQDELLSPLQRWHILSIIEERMRTTREFWIYESENYYNSWWTLGEIMLLSYFQAVSNARPVLKVFHLMEEPGHQLEVEPNGIVPTLEYQQRRTMDRLLSNTGRTMGAETAKRMREIAKIPIIGKSKFFSDEVFSQSFYSTRLMELESLSLNIKQGIDVEKFLQMELPPLEAVPKTVLEEAAINGSTYFQNYEIVKDKPRYMWYATRMGKLNGPEDSDELTLATLPVFRAKNKV